MRNALLAAVAATALVAGCRQAADDQAANTSAPKSGQVLPVTDASATMAAMHDMEGMTQAKQAMPMKHDAAMQLMHDRHEHMEKIGKANKAISRELKASAPRLATVRSSAATIAGLAPKVPSWFPPGTGPDVGKTMAKPGIWQKPQDFAAKAKAFRDTALAFNAAAKTGDMAAINARFGDLGKTCKACHDGYRSEHKK
jgi:cytochrome c556